MSVTTTSPAGAGTSAAGSDAGQKDFLDFLGGILPGAAETVAPSLGIDPRVAGQFASSVLNIFGIGGAGKAFTPALPKEQAVSQLQQLVAPYLSDQNFRTVLGRWMQAAIEPVQAQKEGKAYQPSVDLSKNWFTDAVGSAVDSIGDAISHVDVRQVAQIGMQALPYAMALLA